MAGVEGVVEVAWSHRTLLDLLVGPAVAVVEHRVDCNIRVQVTVDKVVKRSLWTYLEEVLCSRKAYLWVVVAVVVEHCWLHDNWACCLE